MVHARNHAYDRAYGHHHYYNKHHSSFRPSACPPPSAGFVSKHNPKLVYDVPLLPEHDYIFHVTGNYDDAVMQEHMSRWRKEDGSPRTDPATVPALVAAIKKVVKQMQPRLAQVPLTHDFVADEVAHGDGMFRVYLWREKLYRHPLAPSPEQLLAKTAAAFAPAPAASIAMVAV